MRVVRTGYRNVHSSVWFSRGYLGAEDSVKIMRLAKAFHLFPRGICLKIIHNLIMFCFKMQYFKINDSVVITVPFILLILIYIC